MSRTPFSKIPQWAQWFQRKWNIIKFIGNNCIPMYTNGEPVVGDCCLVTRETLYIANCEPVVGDCCLVTTETLYNEATLTGTISRLKTSFRALVKQGFSHPTMLLWIVSKLYFYCSSSSWFSFCFDRHYENTPIQIYWKFHHQKLKIFK